MIGILVRQHPLFRTLPKLLAFALLTATLATNILTFIVMGKKNEAALILTLQLITFQLPESPDITVSLFWLQLVLVLTATVGLMYRGGNIRTSPWYLGLPFSSVNLWRSHYIALLIGFLSLLLFQGVVVAAFIKILEALMDRTIISVGMLALALVSPAMVLIFLSGMVAGYRTDLADLADAAGWKRYRLILLAAGALILAGLSFLPPVFGLIPAAGGAFYARHGRQSLPPGLSLGNGSGNGALTAQPGSWQALASAPVIFNPASPFVSLNILNLLFKVPYPFVILIMLLPGFFGALIGGFSLYNSSTFPDVFRLNNFYLTVYLLFAFSGEFVLRLHKIDALPVDRRALLRYLVVPGMIAVVLSYGGARLWIDYKDIPQEQVKFQDAYTKYGAAVGPGFSEITRRGNTVTVTAPWGESHDSVARHPIPAFPSRLAGNSEFLTDGGPTSREFLAWQLSRAVEKVYGVWIEPSELDARYIELDDEGNFFVPRRAFTVAKDYGLTPRSGGPVAPFLLTPLFVFWFLLSGVYYWFLQRDRTIKWARVVWWVIMGLLFAMHILQTFNMIPMGNHWGWAVLIFSTARTLGEMGILGYLLAYGAGIVLVLLAWRFCSRAFLKMEAPRS